MATEHGDRNDNSNLPEKFFSIDDDGTSEPESPSTPEDFVVVLDDPPPAASPKPPVSDRKREANRRNGKKGGPRTPEGKRRVSQNALKYGGYSGADAIPRGPFAEDPDEVAAFIEAIVN